MFCISFWNRYDKGETHVRTDMKRIHIHKANAIILPLLVFIICVNAIAAGIWKRNIIKYSRLYYLIANENGNYAYRKKNKQEYITGFFYVTT